MRTGNLANVAEQARDKNDSRLTERGRATRERILRVAADMMYVKGVSSTTLDEVRAASGTSKSQLYRHYADKDALVRDVVTLQAAELLERQHQLLQRLNSLRGLERWRNALIEHNALRNGAYGCPLGSLASELADQDEEVRKAIARHFDTWEGLLDAGLERMKDSGVLRADADAGELATGLMAALQGGYLLAQTAQDVKPMRIALDMAIGHVKAHVVVVEDVNPPEGAREGAKPPGARRRRDVPVRRRRRLRRSLRPGPTGLHRPPGGRRRPDGGREGGRARSSACSVPGCGPSRQPKAAALHGRQVSSRREGTIWS